MAKDRPKRHIQAEGPLIDRWTSRNFRQGAWRQGRRMNIAKQEVGLQGSQLAPTRRQDGYTRVTPRQYTAVQA